MIKIFQTGDIHLDSPFSGGDILRSENGRKRLRELFKRMMEFVKENETVKSCDICFVGDSLTEMMDVNNFNNLNCVNRGIISDKSAGILMTLKDRVIDTKPKTIFLLIGSNDICDGYTIKQISDNITDIIKMCKEELKEVRIIVSTILPPCYYHDEHVEQIYPACRDILRIKALNEFIKSLSSYDYVTVFDGYKVLADENDSLRSEDTLDGVHLTPLAYEKLKQYNMERASL